MTSSYVSRRKHTNSDLSGLENAFKKKYQGLGKITQNLTNTNVREVWQGTHCFDVMETVLKGYSGQYSVLI